MTVRRPVDSQRHLYQTRASSRSNRYPAVFARFCSLMYAAIDICMAYVWSGVRAVLFDILLYRSPTYVKACDLFTPSRCVNRCYDNEYYHLVMFTILYVALFL